VLLSVRVSHALRGVAPGDITKRTGFRVYSSTWEVGSEGFVFIDDDVEDENPPLVFSGEIEPGGFVRVLADPVELYAKDTPWFVSLAADEEGVGRSSWWPGLKVHPTGQEDSPLVIENEEDISCGGVGTECAHSILPGQTVRGNWFEPGDQDLFGFIAGAGTILRIRLDRADPDASPQHPDAPIPEVFIAQPDGLVSAYSGPLGLSDTGTSIEVTLTLDGRHHIVARTLKGSGDYLLTVEKVEEGGSGEPVFGWTDDLLHFTTEVQATARMRVPVLDGFGNPLSGVPVVWHPGSACGLNDFCPSGPSVEQMSAYFGEASIEHVPAPGEPSLWTPRFISDPELKKSAQRKVVSKRIFDGRRNEAVFGRIEVYSNAAVSVDLPNAEKARAISKRTQVHATQTAKKSLSKNDELCSQSVTCAEYSKPVFRTVQLQLDEGETLVDLELRILDGEVPTESLDGHEVMTDVYLTVEADAVIQNAQGETERLPISQPVGMAVVGNRGGVIEAGGAVCESLPVTPGPFTFRTGSDAGTHYVYDEPDGSPCCWVPTEYILASAIANVEVDNGQGGTVPLSTNSVVAVESIPRPADPCEVRYYPTDQPVVNTNRYHASQESGDFVSLGYAYLTDACDNIVHGVGMDDSEDHNQPGDEFRVVSPPEPPPGGDGVWAIADSTPDQWRFLLALRGRTTGSSTQIPDGTYTVDFEVESQSQCSEGDSITGSLTVQALEIVPRLTFHWDWDFDGDVSMRGPDPRYSAIGPGSTVRDASDRIAVWRVPAYDDPDPSPYFEGPFTGVPVKIYVARNRTVPFDSEGNVRETYLEPVEGVVLCTGVVEEMANGDGNVEVWQGPVQSTCDQTWTTVAEGFASSDPQLTGHPPDTWVPMGLGVGIVKAPEQPGDYVLVVEPQDEAFRRGDSWRIDSTWLEDNFMEIEVGGGVYLDEEYERFGATIDVPESRQIYVQARLESWEPMLTLDVEYTDPNDASTDTLRVTVNRMGEGDDGGSTFLSEPIELVPDGQQKLAKSGPSVAVKVNGTLASKYLGRLVAFATIDNGGPVDLDIDGDNDNGVNLPDRSPREEDLETGGGYGKFVFVNHNDDDGDGIPDYADVDNPDEGNLVPIVLEIDIPDVLWTDVVVTFEFEGLDEFFDTSYVDIKDPRDQTTLTGFRDFRPSRRTGDDLSGWNYPPMRLWSIGDPSQYRHPENLVIPGAAYSAADLGFGSGEEPGKIVLFVEGINQFGGSASEPQPASIRVSVASASETHTDTVRLTMIEADLGVNNSNPDPFVFNPDEPSFLRPGVPDADYTVDPYDEIVEDQRDGFVFWKRARQFRYRPTDMFPIVFEIPPTVKDSGYRFSLRLDDDDANLIVLENPSSDFDWIQFLSDSKMFEMIKKDLNTQPKPLSEWRLPEERVGRRSSSLLMPVYSGGLTHESKLTIQLVATDRKQNETVVDSFRLTLKPLIWLGEAWNGLFWMGSARGDPGGSFSYVADTVAAAPVVQSISTYPEFEWSSGPAPDQEKDNYLVFVHGFNINPDQAFEDAAELYKRLWWSGYRGNFIGLSWHGDEWDPLNNACDAFLPAWMDRICTAMFFPNMENALQTSPQLKRFLKEKICGEWGGEPENVYLMAHSLGNLVALDALRLHAVESNEILIQHMVSIEAAVWEETFWNQGPVTYTAELAFSEDELMRGSWAFWFNQEAHPVSESFARMFNSYASQDAALIAMKINDVFPVTGPQCVYPLPGPTLGPCPRGERRLGRGSGANFRVPVADDFHVGDEENRPDLWYEIPALLNLENPNGHLLPWNEVSSPLGMVEMPTSAGVNTSSIVAEDLGWPDTEHSFFLRQDFAKTWEWFEFLTTSLESQPNRIVPTGEE
jgi:hypothetical protein